MIRTLFSIFIFFIGGIVCKGQVVLYSTDFGTGTTFPSGWSVAGATGNIEISTATPSNNYTSPISYSGGSNLNDGATGAATGTAIVTVAGLINTIGYTSIQVLFGARETASFNGSFLFDWSIDGSTWNSITYTNVTNNATWQLINGGTWLTLPASAENQSNLRFRFSFSRSGGVGNYSIDDFTVQGYALSGSSATDYFRSKQSGNWNLSSSWESSPDNSTWITSTLIPTSSAKKIQIRNGHTITINGSAAADELIIESGGILNHPNSATFTINNGTGDDMTVDGIYVFYGANPAGTGTYVVRTGGIIRADANTGGIADNIAVSTNTRATFKTGSIFQWNNTSAFGANGITYFNSDTEYPVFRISQNISLDVGGGSNTLIKGMFEANASITFTGGGIKTFRDGIIGSGTISQTNPCGAFIITGTNAELGGTGIISLSGSGLEIASGAQVLLTSNKTINLTTFINYGTFNCQAFVVSGSTTFTHSASATLGIGSADGITSAGIGNIQTTGRSYSSSANYTFNGTTNQVTGNFTTTPVANTINSLNIANTGNTVTLTNNNLTTTTLYLNSGYFASGTGQTLRIAANGIIYGTGGHNPNNASAGNIEFIGNGSTNGILSGYPNLYSIIANGAIDFNGLLVNTQSATILNKLQLNTGSYLISAPYYSSGSTLVYNTGGTYGRNVEWGNSSGTEGYPHHVTVQGNTILDLNTNTIAPPQLGMGGDLTIGNASSWGRVYLNNSMNKALSVGGSLTIGSSNAASNSSELFLSNTGGGDLWLYGSFTRYSGSSFTDNNRAVFFKGSSNASINTPNVTITPGVPTQYFSYAILDKTNGTEIITLNCPLGISKLITFTKGVITSSANYPLVVIDDADATGASTLSFVNGPVKKIGNNAFTFPVGKVVGLEFHHRTIGISAPAATTDAFTAEFFRSDSYLRGSISAIASGAGLQRVSRCENWGLARNAGSSNVAVTLSWTNQSRCNVSYVTDLGSLVVAQYNGTQWGNLFGRTSISGGVGPNSNGQIIWLGADTYNYFTLGSTDLLENPLPLTLSSFTAKARKIDVQIDWHIMNNNDQDEYIIERSNNGVRFELLKKVEAKIILDQAAYTELDQKPFNGWNYYRLRVIDKAGEAKVSNVVKVWFGINEQIRISPNPASEKVVINLSEPSSIFQIELVNISGQVLRTVTNIQFSTEINISQMQAGIYYLRILGKNGLVVKSFVKN